jgi:S-adenosylmethionine hydrolase
VFISFLSDYGTEDEFVGVCHGVIAQRAPHAQVIDVTHAIPRHDVLAGALTLAAAVEFLPRGVLLAVVDPGVGTERRALALACAREGRVLVGPDNGLLGPAAERLGGVTRAVDISDTPERLHPTSGTFHGRDVFAPVAAALAAGAPLQALGKPIDIDALVALALPRAKAVERGLLAHALHRDGFGNLALDVSREQLLELGLSPESALVVERGALRRPARWLSAFAQAPAGELLLYEDSWGMLALAVNLGSAAELLGVHTGDELLLSVPDAGSHGATLRTP